MLAAKPYNIPVNLVKNLGNVCVDDLSAVVTDASHFAVCWLQEENYEMDYHDSIYMQRFNLDGNSAGESFLIAEDTGDGENEVSVTNTAIISPDADGGFGVCWQQSHII